ncbi:MAG: DNA polymerase III subunit alpha [Bacilli bacterium]|nr:DNA polymerase III subunit alpha [Bacilli bacterium]
MYSLLYNKSNYTLLSSLLKIDDIVSYAKNNNISAIALSDNNMHGTMEFINKCKKENIKPIIGLSITIDNKEIVLYAKDYKGYQSLIKIATIQSERSINSDDLDKYNKNVICIIPFSSRELIDKLKNTYVDLYLGYSNKTEEKEARILTKEIIFFRKSLYLDKKDSELLPYLYRIRDGKTINDDMDYDISNHELNVTNIKEFSSEDGLVNISKVIDMCNLEFPEVENLLPIYDVSNPKKYLFDLCRAGLTKRLGGEIPDNYKERLVYELKVINDMGFNNYFLVVYDYIKFAKKNKILVGPGRGSAAGSLVAYSLGITDIDPLEYGLLFERFLNPERKTMPDIDTDFPDNKRDLVIDYVKEKYGEKRVSGIITFGTLAAKQVIRDVSRVLNIPLYKVDALCKFIPNMSHDKLIDVYNNNETFRVRVDSDSSLKKMFQIASKIEGFPRHISSHAAGIVMSKVDLDEVIPLEKVDDMYLTGYSMEYLEPLGLLKMDFLVIKNLTLIDNVIKDIKEIYDEEVDFNKIPLDDKETLKLFGEANTCGIFQFESAGMRNFLRKLRPNSINDIIAAIALFRPGAAVNIDSYIRRKHGEEKITYLDESLEEITKDTYGILIYQEQIMQVASRFAGYTLGEADILRRAMSKKKVDLLKSEEEKFITKSEEMGHSEEKAKEIFNLVLNFAGYGFNKSHSVVYSVVAYKMAYLKCHYKTVFFANLLSNVIGSETKTNEYIMEAKANKIEIEKPTISNSESRYIVKDNTIIYPISNIKGIGVVVSKQIEEAKKDGSFTDIYDCFSRLYIAGIGKKTFEILIMADVFNEYKYNRATLMYNLDSLFNYAELTKDIDPSLVMKPELEIQKEYEQNYLLEQEKEVFGFYLSSHPTTMYKGNNPNCVSLNELDNYLYKTIDMLVLIDKIKVINTKKGDKMAFITGSDETKSCEFTLFPKVYSNYQELTRGNIIKIRGKAEKRLNEIQVIVDRIKVLQGEDNEE